MTVADAISTTTTARPADADGLHPPRGVLHDVWVIARRGGPEERHCCMVGRHHDDGRRAVIGTQACWRSWGPCYRYGASHPI